MKKEKKILTTIKIDSTDGSVNIKKQGYAPSLALPNAIVVYNDADSVIGYVTKSSLDVLSYDDDGVYSVITTNSNTSSAVSSAKMLLLDRLSREKEDLDIQIDSVLTRTEIVREIDINPAELRADEFIATPKEPEPSPDRDVPDGGVLDYHGVEVFAGDKVRYMYERGLESGEYICYVGDKYELILNNTPTKYFLYKGINYPIIKESK